MDYSELPALSTYYLEDSYVLAINTEPGQLTFTLEAVLTEDHPQHHQPHPDEQYCYAHAQLVFANISSMEWTSKNDQTYTDASGEEDLGNIDYLTREDRHWKAGGDWGEVLIFTETPPTVTLTS